ncbi:MAG: glycosyltransferase family 2 protein, partial [bacterium]
MYSSIFNKKQLIEEIRKHYEAFYRDNKVDYKEIILRNAKSDLRVSVVTPVYNGEKFVYDAFNSLENQTIVESIEWVIIDDCSTDSTFELIKKLSINSKIGKIKLLRLDKNMGQSFGLWLGFRNTSCD